MARLRWVLLSVHEMGVVLYYYDYCCTLVGMISDFPYYVNTGVEDTDWSMFT